MKTIYKLLILSFVLFSTTYNYAQIDTTIYYPLKIGNYWQYSAITGEYVTHQIVGDTIIMGKSYFTRETNFSSGGKTYNYLRADGELNEFVYHFACFNEYLLYDFTVQDSAIWLSCGVVNNHIASFYTHYRYLSIINQQLYTKSFVDAFIDSSVVPPETTYYYVYLDKISRGVGLVEMHAEAAPIYRLEGFIQNGIHYGNTSLFVGVDDDEQVITDFSLHQNYPNPFNPITKIKFTIPSVIANEVTQSLVTLKVYDVLGNEVATLVNEYKPAGSYEVEFDAEGLSSGIYFYKLQAGEYVETKKMLLLK